MQSKKQLKNVNEEITKDQWENDYKGFNTKFYDEFDGDLYEVVKPALFNLFNKIKGGTVKDNMILLSPDGKDLEDVFEKNITDKIVFNGVYKYLKLKLSQKPNERYAKLGFIKNVFFDSDGKKKNLGQYLKSRFDNRYIANCVLLYILKNYENNKTEVEELLVKSSCINFFDDDVYIKIPHLKKFNREDGVPLFKNRDLLAEEEKRIPQEHIDFVIYLIKNRIIYTTVFEIKWLYIETFKMDNYIIGFSYDHRWIASQSTMQGWTSCMNLDGGIYSHLVGSGASAGSFIAYIINKPNVDKDEIRPQGRVLFKPFFEKKVYQRLFQYGDINVIKDNEVLWVADKEYGETPDWFISVVSKIVDKAQGKKTKHGDYVLNEKMIYNDNFNSDQISVISDKKIKEEVEKLKNNPEYFKEISATTFAYVFFASDKKMQEWLIPHILETDIFIDSILEYPELESKKKNIYPMFKKHLNIFLTENYREVLKLFTTLSKDANNDILNYLINNGDLKKLSIVLSCLDLPSNDDELKFFIKDKSPLIQLLIASTADRMDILEPELADFACKNITKIKEIDKNITKIKEIEWYALILKPLTIFIIQNCTSLVLLKIFCSFYIDDTVALVLYNRFFNLFLMSCSKERKNINIDFLLNGFQNCHIDECNSFVEIINHIFSWVDSDKCNITFNEKAPSLSAIREVYDIFNDFNKVDIFIKNIFVPTIVKDNDFGKNVLFNKTLLNKYFLWIEKYSTEKVKNAFINKLLFSKKVEDDKIDQMIFERLNEIAKKGFDTWPFWYSICNDNQVKFAKQNFNKYPWLYYLAYQGNVRKFNGNKKKLFQEPEKIFLRWCVKTGREEFFYYVFRSRVWTLGEHTSDEGFAPEYPEIKNPKSLSKVTCSDDLYISEDRCEEYSKKISQQIDKYNNMKKEIFGE